MPPLYKRFFIEVDFNVGLSGWGGGGTEYTRLSQVEID